MEPLDPTVIGILASAIALCVWLVKSQNKQQVGVVDRTFKFMAQQIDQQSEVLNKHADAVQELAVAVREQTERINMLADKISKR
jgi:uncharacterized protein YoxC